VSEGIGNFKIQHPKFREISKSKLQLEAPEPGSYSLATLEQELDTNCTNSHETRNERTALRGENVPIWSYRRWKSIASWTTGHQVEFVLIRAIRVKILKVPEFWSLKFNVHSRFFKKEDDMELVPTIVRLA